MERAWAAPPTSVHRGNSLTCRNEEPKLSPSGRGSSSSPRCCRGGDRQDLCTQLLRNAPSQQELQSSSRKAQSPGEPAWVRGAGYHEGFCSPQGSAESQHWVWDSRPGWGGQALQWWGQAGSSRGGADCDRVLRACARPGRVAELEPRAPQHLQGCQVLCGAGMGSFPPQPLMCPPEAAEPVPKRAEQTSGFLPQVSPECPNKEDKLVQKKPWA